MTLDLDELERIVSVATPGPWRVEGLIKRGGMIAKIISHGMNERGDGPAGYVGDTYGVADAEFVAALNPTVCLALIARARDAERLEDKVDGLTADLRSAVEVAFLRGATEWVRLNYPADFKRLSALNEGGPQ